MKKLIITLLFFLTLNACQPIEKVNHIVFDNSQFARFNILSTSVEINEIFKNNLKIKMQRILMKKTIINMNYFICLSLVCLMTQVT